MALASMADRYVRPDWVRRLNAMGGAAGGADAVVPIDADQLLELATGRAGDDFRDLGDGDWETRFRLLIDAVEANDMHVVGRLQTRTELLRCLITRIRLGRMRADHPEISDETIVAPVAVVGPARSGTTITFELVGLDPTLRTPIATDVMHVGSPADDDERRRVTECEQELWADVQPEFASIHELRSDLPVECVTIAAPSFAGNHWTMVLGQLADWVPDPAADFALHRAVLQAAQFDKPAKSWLIKTPAYLLGIDDLFAAYPDVTLVMTHRDPAKTMPSTVSTKAMVEWMRRDAVDVETLSLLVGAVFTDALRQVTEGRAAGEFPVPVGDVRFTDLLADPTGTIGGAYEALGRPFSDEHAAAIDTYVRDKPQGKHGTHHYTAADWGFDEATVRTELAAYLDHFGLETEA